MSDNYKPSIWPRIDLGDGTIAKLAPSGLVRIEQTTAGDLVTIWLEPEQVQAFIRAWHQLGPATDDHQAELVTAA